MKQFGKILKFEVRNYFTNKVFVGVTLFLVLAIAVVMFFPRFTQASDSPDSSDFPNSPESSDFQEAVSSADLPTMLVISDMQGHSVEEAFAAAFPSYHVVLTADSLDDVKGKITSGEVECAFVLESPTSYTYYVNNLSMYDSNTFTADSVLQNLYQMNAMMKTGMTAQEAEDALSVQIENRTENLGKNQMQNFSYTYVMIFALYLVILLYGQMVAGNVATEKSSRAMELLITSAKPVSMMFGKVIASCIAGLIQLVAVFGSALVCFHLNKAYWADTPMISSVFDMPVDLFLYMLVFFILGFLIYAFMYGAIGSTTSKLEDINTAVMPVTLLFVIAFLVVMFSMGAGNVDTLLMKVCSFIPFTSPMAMFTRLAMSTVPVYEVVISIAILIGSAIGIGVLAAKIYRVGVLLYGNTPKISSIWKAIKKA